MRASSHIATAALHRYIERVNEIPRREITLPREFYVALGIAVAGYLLYTLSSVLTPLLLAFAIAYVLDPLIDRLEAAKIPRPLAIALVLVTSLGALGVFVALVLPMLATEVAQVASELPKRIAGLMTSAEPWLQSRGIRVPQTTTEWMERLGQNANALVSSVLAPAGGFLSSVVGSSFSLIGSVVAALVVPVLAVYFLNDFDRITAGMRGLLPRRYRRTVTAYAREIDAVLSHFIRGQLTVMLIMGLLYGVSYALLGVRLALVIGVVAGAVSFIPYLGSAFALVAGLGMSLLGGFNVGQLVGVVIAYAVIQALEGFVIAPRIMGKTVGLPEMWVLIALFIGGEIFGFLGVLLAVPAAAVAKIFVTHAVDLYQESDLYLEGPESLRSVPPPPVAPTTPPPAGASMPPASVAAAKKAEAPSLETPIAGLARPKEPPESS
jgi:predicted PurR-regulated permease PerM